MVNAMTILAQCARMAWRYSRPLAVVTEPVEWDGVILAVVGDPTEESFEWLHLSMSGRIIGRSDAGYRDIQGALRDGLMAG